jgi:hypothetical protein
MKVRARAFKPTDVSAKLSPYLNQRFVTVAKEYDVHAIAVFNGIVFVQTVDDLGYPSWSPDVIFDVSDHSIPSDWICSLLANQSSDDASLLLGPEFVAKDQASYEAMVEMDAEKVDQFWKRLDAKKEMDELT